MLGFLKLALLFGATNADTISFSLVPDKADQKQGSASEQQALEAVQKAGGVAHVTIFLKFPDKNFADKDLETVLDKLQAMPGLCSGPHFLDHGGS